MRSQLIPTILFVAAVAVAVGLALRPGDGSAGAVSGAASGSSGGAVQKWQYNCVLPPGARKSDMHDEDRSIHDQVHHAGGSSHPSRRVLDHMGAKGWELVAIDQGNGHYCFKRPKQ